MEMVLITEVPSGVFMDNIKALVVVESIVTVGSTLKHWYCGCRWLLGKVLTID